MISKIKKLKNYGIFRDFNGEATKEFGKLNLIYGWNGSGKSTLSKVFESLEKRRNVQASAEPSCEFSVILDGNTIITEKTLHNPTPPCAHLTPVLSKKISTGTTQ